MAEIFKAFFLTSCVGSVLALVLAALKPLTRKFFSPSWNYYIWLAVLLVMIIPVRLDIAKVPDIPTVSNITLNAERLSENTQNLEVIQSETVINNKVATTEKAYGVHIIKNVLVSNMLLFSFIWISVSLALILYKIVSYILFLGSMRKNSEIISCPEAYAYTKRKITVRVSDLVCSPLLTGIFKPTLLLPKTQMSANQLQNILAHEMTHLKRNDILYKWFANLVKCIHWFNPAVYFINKQINNECEISCDLAVCKNMNKEEEIGYINTILSLLSAKNSKSIPLTTGMTGTKKTLKTRFTLIKNRIKTSKKATVISLVSAFLLLGITVFASGVLNGKILQDYEKIVNLNTDEVTDNINNFLLLGLDSNGNADTIMLLSSNGEVISIVSVPRDTGFVSEKGLQKASELLGEENGDQKVIDAVKSNLSIPVNYYAKINLTALEKIVDLVGGIEFDVPMDMVYDDTKQDLHINLKKGRHILTGKEACALLQFRTSNQGKGYTGGDLSRIDIGQQFIKEFITQKLNKDNLKNMPDIYHILSENIIANFSVSDILSGNDIFANKNVNFYTMPGNTFSHNNKMFYEIDFKKAENILFTLGYKLFENKNSQVSGFPIKQESETRGEVLAMNNDLREQVEETKIKSTLSSDSLYEGFERLTLKNATAEKIQTHLQQQGIYSTQNDSVDLKKNFICDSYNYTDSDIASNIKCDSNGNITLYLTVNQENLFDVIFYDTETDKEVASYGILADNENIYSFLGFDPEKTYNIVIKDSSYGTFDINGQYIIY